MVIDMSVLMMIWATQGQLRSLSCELRSEEVRGTASLSYKHDHNSWTCAFLIKATTKLAVQLERK